MNEEYHRTLADHAFESIKFLLSLFLKVLSLYFAIFAAFVAFQTSSLTSENVDWQMKVLATSVSLFIAVYLWITWYLILRGSLEYQKQLQILSGNQEDRRLSGARAKLMTIGTILAWSGTGVVIVIVFIIFAI